LSKPEEGYYWVRPNADEPFELALYRDGAWWFIGLSKGAESVEEIREVIVGRSQGHF
jgi:hypothetical protein